MGVVHPDILEGSIVKIAETFTATISIFEPFTSTKKVTLNTTVKQLQKKKRDFGAFLVEIFDREATPKKKRDFDAVDTVDPGMGLY